MDSKVLRIISRLNKQSNRERNGSVKVAPDQEVLAITAETGVIFLNTSQGNKCKTSIGSRCLCRILHAVVGRGNRKEPRYERDNDRTETAKGRHSVGKFQEAGVDKIIG
ncbi:MAG: hypothetical protein M3270_07735 [Thermoproteota archaeon]|nr:hypothetical protein [Thermoproteota archaeon]